MKKFTLTLSVAAAAFFAIPSTTFAQDNPPRPAGPAGAGRMDPAEHLKVMAEQLGLDADQQVKVKAIFDKNVPKFKEIMAKGLQNLTEAELKEMRDLAKSQMDEIAAVLTPEQQDKLKQLRPHARGEAKPDAPK